MRHNKNLNLKDAKRNKVYNIENGINQAVLTRKVYYHEEILFYKFLCNGKREKIFKKEKINFINLYIFMLYRQKSFFYVSIQHLTIKYVHDMNFYLPFPCLKSAKISSNVLFFVSGTFLYVNIQNIAKNTLNGKNV